MQFRQLLTLAAKDWRLFWSDRRAAALCFITPIFLASIFGIIFDRQGHGAEEVRLPMLVVANADDPFLRQLVSDFESSPRMAAQFVSRETAMKRLADRQPGIAVILPDTWDETHFPRVEILHHPLCSREAQWAEGIITELIMKRWTTEKLGPIFRSRMIERPFQCERVAVAGDSGRFNSYSHSFNGMTLQYLLFWGMESGLLLLRERQRGVWLRLRISPVPFRIVLFARALATAAIAALQLLATFAFGYFVFGVTIGGSLIGFLLLAMALCGFTASVGLLVAAVGGNESRGRNVSILAILCLSMVGGLWLPSFLLPAWLRELSLALPTTWAMQGLDAATWQGRDLCAVLPSIGVIALFAAACLCVAWWRFARLDRPATTA